MSKKNSDLVTNRRASYDYELLDTYEAGIILTGTEIKSLRNHGGSLQEAYVRIFGSEVWLVGCHIAPYNFGNIHNHEERRDRKLLLHKREIAKLKTATQEKGLAIVPLSIYLSQGYAKLRIAIARGKKSYDKRHAIKARDEKKRMEQAQKEHS